MNPPTTKPTDTPLRAYRGGSWYNNVPSWVRAASRFTYEPAYRYSDIGFRCALRAREPRV
jgi:formylglycine-generating enzyme required for sulfatase activity